MNLINKKILIDCSTLSKGGGIQVAISTIKSILDINQGINYKFILPKSIYYYLPEDIRNLKGIFWIKKNTKIEKLKLIFLLYFINFKFRPDIVYTLFGPSYFKAFCIHIVGFAKPYLIYPTIKENKTLKNYLKNILEIIFFKFSNFYIVETNTVKVRLNQILKFDSEKIFVIENGVNPEIKNLIVPKKNIQNNQILVPATYYPHKNLEIIIPIAHYLLKFNKDIKFILTIDDREFKNNFNLNYKNVNLKKCIHNIGPQKISNLAEYYIYSEIIFLPTLLECSTAVYPEAFYFKRPLITSDLDFARDLCQSAAIYCNPRDYKNCANNILLLLNNQRLKNKLVSAGSIQLKNYLDGNQRILKLQSVFEKTLNSKLLN